LDPAQVTFSPIEGELRLASDMAISRHPETACAWESFINQQDLMTEEFKSAMFKLSNVGQNTDQMADCSELIPMPPSLPTTSAAFPKGYTSKDVNQFCTKRSPFPSLNITEGNITPLLSE